MLSLNVGIRVNAHRLNVKVVRFSYVNPRDFQLAVKG